MKGAKRPIDQVDEPEEQSTMAQFERYRATLRDILPELADDHPLFSRVAAERFRGHFAVSTPGSASNAPNTLVTAPSPASGLVRPSDADRLSAIEDHIADGGIVNPTHATRGVGRYEWLQDYDRLRALALGINSHEAFTAMREQGLLAIADGPRSEPGVVWYPERSYLNPRRQPDGTGHFEFQSPDDEELAALNFGGPTGYGLPARPSAAEIWQLRGGFLRQRRNDLTENITVVWIPDEQHSGTIPNVTSTTPAAPATKPKRKYKRRVPSANNDDQEPQPDVYDPTNGQPGGINDQTSSREHPRYYAIKVDGKQICQDRSTAQVGLREPHLMRAYGKTGWRTWTPTKPPKLKDFDWNNKVHMDLLDRWRYQVGYRSDFDNLRDEHRDLYSLEECQWLAEEYQALKKDGRIHPPDNFLDMTKRFNAKFGGDRVHGAMRTKYDRVRKDFEKTGKVTGPTLYEKRPKTKSSSKIRLVVKKPVASEAGKPATPSVLDVVRAALASNTPSKPADSTTAQQQPSDDDSAELEDETEVTGEVTEGTEMIEEGEEETEILPGADEDTAILIDSDGSVGSAERLGEAAKILHRMSGGSRDGEK
ncbi:hypothetical protein B0A48_16453 [Cryoendolithus antarcticus]|uniref:Uncharacterized protein n=1 Tax=Cryoendolithus antarcticus TaxID=1507870 RepID=A0A1V8SES5_9PEZI|nr:hypothetical protein B0A48_16453 [Cryoendolithus antarcticus]